MTGQVPEYLTWNGAEFPIRAEPLAPYIMMTDIDLLPPGVLNSACWRGYVARWEVNDKRLYLMGIDGISESDPLSLVGIFPGFDYRVFAHWFSGSIIIPVHKKPIGGLGARPMHFTLRVQEGCVFEWPNEGRSGYMISKLARAYEDYAPKLSDLSERVTITAIEANAIVSDPMGAVPAKPFGHMNWKWKEFKSELKPDAAVWRFTCPWGGSHLHSGYATVAGDRVDRFILTSIAEIDG